MKKSYYSRQPSPRRARFTSELLRIAIYRVIEFMLMGD
jgi:hypothetical protein